MAYSQTAWVKNSREATGQDQLGLRFFSETIYQDLLPHITNVTSRARYYSFYPWLVWAVESRAEELKDFSLKKIVRRADCLMTLIGLYHSRISENESQSLHDGLIGAKRLGSVLSEMLESGASVRLSQFATEEESPDRYFKNKFGGLGQYYFGPLRDAGILTYNEKGEINYTEDRGLVIAEAFNQSVASDRFFEVLVKDQVSEEDLDNLIDFCPCLLAENPAEQNALIDFLFSRDEIFAHPLWARRKESLNLILDFIQKSTAYDLKILPDSSGVHSFLSAAYTGALDENLLWENDNEQTLETRLLWRQYYAGELLSFAIQTLFWAGLTKIVEDDVLVYDCRSYGSWFAEKFTSSVKEFNCENFAAAAGEIEINLPEITDWKNENHEIALTRRLERIVRDKNAPERREKAVALAVKIMLSLAARWQNENREATDFPVSFSSQQLSEYPINLTNFLRFAETDWRGMKLNHWLAWLSCRWGVETHLMIALRKLQGESLDTFKVFPSEEGLRVKEFVGDKTIDEVLMPGFTSPRLRTTLQILWDIGLITVKDDSLNLTLTGETVLEELGDG
jgi:hypothetical protein